MFTVFMSGMVGTSAYPQVEAFFIAYLPGQVSASYGYWVKSDQRPVSQEWVLHF